MNRCFNTKTVNPKWENAVNYGHFTLSRFGSDYTVSRLHAAGGVNDSTEVSIVRDLSYFLKNRSIQIDKK